MSTALSWYRRRLGALGDAFGFDLDTAMEDLTEQQWRVLMHGTDGEDTNYLHITSATVDSKGGPFEYV